MKIHKNGFIYKAGFWEQYEKASIWFYVAVSSLCICAFFYRYLPDFVLIALILSGLISVIPALYFFAQIKCPNCRKSLGLKFKLNLHGNLRDPALVSFCPHCGFDPESKNINPKYLENIPERSKSGTVLEGTYLEIIKDDIKNPKAWSFLFFLYVGFVIYFYFRGFVDEIHSKNPEVPYWVCLFIYPIGVALFISLIRIIVNASFNSSFMKKRSSILRIVLGTIIIIVLLAVYFYIKSLLGYSFE
jgi:hypothetical protein